MARDSVESLSGVDVPWATIQSISSAVTPDRSRAIVIARDAPRPVGSATR